MITIDLKHCTGCGACIQKCPCHSIYLAENEEGFLFPKINLESCVNCQKCDNVCPINIKIPEKSPVAYAAINSNKSELMLETSGGVFGAISDYVLENGGTVYGCAFTKQIKAVHIRVSSIEELSMLYGSKYVQSDTRNTFLEAENDLKNGKLVLYSGTPCQIAGLKSFLKIDYDNLITVDLVCHGVPSQAFFDKFIDGLAGKRKSAIESISFRSKQIKGWSCSGEYSYTKNGRSIKKPFYYFENYYYWYFLHGASYRESCYLCKYANLNRQGDFTIGDFWGAEEYNLKFKTNNGCSLVLVNSEKGRELFEKLNLTVQRINLKDAVKNNQQLQKPSQRPPERDNVIEQFKLLTADEMQIEFKKRYRVGNFIARIKYIVPVPVRSVLQKIRYRLK